MDDPFLDRGAEHWRPPLDMRPDTTFRSRVPIHELRTHLTPGKDVLVLAHFGIARIDAQAWRLHFSGMGRNLCAMTLDEIKAFPRCEVESFIKCAGMADNHRIATRNVSNALWTGARLVDVLDYVGVPPRASHLWFVAPDHGHYMNWQADSYTKDLPVSRALAEDVLLAYEMNHAPLTAEHGFPVRLFVPGYYGTNSVKWLSRIVAADRRAPGIFTNQLYNDPVVDARGEPTGYTAPVWGVAPEALIVSPPSGARLARGRITISGWCWGQHPIARVELSCDGGQTWRETTPALRHQTSWQPFAFELIFGTSGKRGLQVRATDTRGVTQPFRDARNAVHQISITIEDSDT